MSIKPTDTGYGLLLALVFCIAAWSQPLLVWAGQPNAVWFWCSIMRFC